MRWSDLDLRRQSVRVQRVRTFKGSERDGSKTHTERDVDLVPQALEALRTMRAHTLLRRAERAQEEDTEADVFQNPATSRPWHDERSQRDHCWKPALKHLGIRWRYAYNTRHNLRDGGADGQRTARLHRQPIGQPREDAPRSLRQMDSWRRSRQGAGASGGRDGGRC